jgi:4-hydroxybenzoate polyprenyltransferase
MSPTPSAALGIAVPNARRAPLAMSLVRELRPQQWLKNGLVFFALLYALYVTNIPLLLQSVVAFVAFCCISSSGYVFNDLRDLEYDRLHPTKRFRPLASGQVSKQTACVVAAVLFIGGFGLAATLGIPFLAVCAGYVALTFTYSLWLKHLVIIDVFVVSGGFVLRIVAGAVAIGVPISPWLYVCTALGALVIALGKRRSEIAGLGESPESHRPSLEHYTADFLDLLIVITATGSVMAYSLYTFSAENVPRNHLMMITIPLVLFGVFRYLFLVQVRGLGGSPEELLLKDRSLAAAVALFLALSAGILYVSPRGA